MTRSTNTTRQRDLSAMMAMLMPYAPTSPVCSLHALRNGTSTGVSPQVTREELAAMARLYAARLEERWQQLRLP